MRRPLSRTISALAVVTAPQAVHGQARPSPDPRTVAIALKAVRIVLPIEQRNLWRWHLPETPDNQGEYDREVVVDTTPARGFGFYLFKFAGASPGSGDLSALLQAGQQTVWERAFDSTVREVPNARIVISPADSGLAITIADRWTIDFLFGGRPALGLFRSLSLGGAPRKIPLHFEYVP